MNFYSWLTRANDFVKQYADPAADALQGFSDRVEDLAEVVRKLKGGFFADPSDASVTKELLAEVETNCNTALMAATQRGSAVGAAGISPTDILAYIQIVKAILDWWKNRRQN